MHPRPSLADMQSSQGRHIVAPPPALLAVQNACAPHRARPSTSQPRQWTASLRAVVVPSLVPKRHTVLCSMLSMQHNDASCCLGIFRPSFPRTIRDLPFGGNIKIHASQKCIRFGSSIFRQGASLALCAKPWCIAEGIALRIALSIEHSPKMRRQRTLRNGCIATERRST